MVALRYVDATRIQRKSMRMTRIFSLIGGRSHCPLCKIQLRWYELMPVLSFVLQLGRCRSCRKRISPQYPVVELLSGILFVIVFLRIYQPLRIYELSESTKFLFVGFWVFVFWLLLLMSVIDIRRYIIPDGINIALFLLGAVVLFLPYQAFVGGYEIVFQFFESGFLNQVLGSLVAGGFFWSVHLVTRGKGMGFGDVKLAFALGFLLGWPDMLFAVLFAFLLGGFWSSIMLLFSRLRVTSPNTIPSYLYMSGTGNEFCSNKRMTLKSKLPFGPFLALGVAWLVFFGEETLRAYFGLFS